MALALTLTACTNNPSGESATGSTTPVVAKVMIPSPTYGSGSHALTLYADFQCPACIAFSKSIAPIFEEYAEKWYLTITYKQFPLTSIHRNALRDSIAGLCAAEQGHYMEYKKNLYALEDGKSWAKVNDSERINAAAGTPLDGNKLSECLTADKYLPQVYAEMEEGNTAGVNGTPTLIMDGKKLDLSIFRSTDILRKWLDQYLWVPAPSASGATK